MYFPKRTIHSAARSAEHYKYKDIKKAKGCITMKKALIMLSAFAASMIPFGVFAAEESADFCSCIAAEDSVSEQEPNKKENEHDGSRTDGGAYSVSSLCVCGYFGQKPIPQGTSIVVNADHLLPAQHEKASVDGAEILIDGRKTGIRMDASGRALVTLYETGTHTLSADFTPFGYSDSASLTYTVVPAKNAVNVRIVIRLSNRLKKDAVLDRTLSVTDIDGDGRITSDDALRLAHRGYYDQGGEYAGMNQNRIWGRSGKYLCEVSNPEGKNIYSGSAVGPGAVNCVLSEGDTVIFCPKDCPDEMFEPRWADSSLNACEPVFCMGDSITVKALHFLPEQVDAEWIEDIEILIDDKETGIFTDKNGEAVIPMESLGEHKLSLKVKGLFAEKSGWLWYSVAEGSTTTEIRREVTRQPANAPALQTERAAETGRKQSGGVRTGEETPIAPLAFAALTAAGGVIILARKKG